MSDETGRASPSQSFVDLVAQSGPFLPHESPEKRTVEFVGRVYSAAAEGTFTMALLPGADRVERVIEASVADVVHHEIAFEDTSGRKTLKVRMPEDAPPSSTPSRSGRVRTAAPAAAR